jgi:hypothetical protein
MKIIITISLILVAKSFYCQNIHHQMISSQSNTTDTNSGLTIRQTLGQLSAIGNYSDNIIVQQGFHQSNWGVYLLNPKNILVKTYPNPFIEIVNFQLNGLNTNKISIQIFDINGKIVDARESLIENNLCSLKLTNLARGVYLVKLDGKKLSYYSKIIKQ